MRIELEDARRMVHAAVAERGPDFRYGDMFYPSPCEYMARPLAEYDNPDAPLLPACIVGVAFALAGCDTEGWYGAFGPDKASAWGVEISDDAAWYMRAAQLAQDGGKTWGEALAVADEAFPPSVPVTDPAVEDLAYAVNDAVNQVMSDAQA